MDSAVTVSAGSALSLLNFREIDFKDPGFWITVNYVVTMQ
jgi:hypothetical protein